MNGVQRWTYKSWLKGGSGGEAPRGKNLDFRAQILRFAIKILIQKILLSKTYTITAALPYTNGPIHIGHLAGVYIPADIYARFLRITGNDVVYICGSDEHGVPITIKAKKENKSPQEIVDRYHQNIKQSFSEFGILFAVFLWFK